MVVNSYTCGCAIDHGQQSIIENNVFSGNAQAIALWTDSIAHYPYPCINQSVASSVYTIRGNTFATSTDVLMLVNCSAIRVYNNAFRGGSSANDNGGTSYSLHKPVAGKNIVGGSMMGGNYWQGETCAGSKVFGDPYRSATMTASDSLPLCPPSKEVQRDRHALVLLELLGHVPFGRRPAQHQKSE